MAIDDKDIKLLWGKAAGRCSYPGCQTDLAPLLLSSGPTILGEMAHVIGRKPRAARSDAKVGIDDSYLNLVLLCPTHHTLIDKAEADFSVDMLRKWKHDWEGQVAAAFPRIENRDALFAAVNDLLVENKQVHSQWGPTSRRAQTSPQSCESATYWQLRRIGVIIPNNRTIVSLLKANRKFLKADEWNIVAMFVEHVDFFERHCADPADSRSYLPFPEEFETLIAEGLVNG